MHSNKPFSAQMAFIEISMYGRKSEGVNTIDSLGEKLYIRSHNKFIDYTIKRYV